MIYSLVRPLARIALKVYFREIYLSHAERIPKDKPVLLACNHPTGFMEPCIMACFLDRPLYFLVRGDFFAKRHFERMLRALHMLPVFRLKDGGYSKLKENFDTFAACHRALADNRSIMIFAEGSTKLVKHLRPLQKGIARIAFGSLESRSELEDVYVVPVGVTYMEVNTFRSKVMIDCGHPISARRWLDGYRAEPNEAMNGLLAEIADGMRRCLVHVEQYANLDLADRLLLLQDSQPPPPMPPVFSRNRHPLTNARHIAAGLNAMDEEALERTSQDLDALERALRQSGLSGRVPWPIAKPSALQRAGLALSWIPAGLGRWLNFPPLYWIRSLVAKQVKSVEFKAPVMVAGGLGIYLICWLVLVALLLLVFGWPWIALALLPPVLGRIALWHYDASWRARAAKKWAELQPDRRDLFLKERKRLLKRTELAAVKAGGDQGGE